ncbi:hypothetical protein FB446DRAFT_794522 [Lentinula raphanica]|nr:hypothetical protein FB446DRAFT_794522 [Lentinula raphanica]
MFSLDLAEYILILAFSVEIPTAPPTPTPNIHGRTLRRHDTFYFEAPIVQEIPTAPPTPTPDIQGRTLRRYETFYFQTPTTQVLIPTEPPTPRNVQGRTLRRHETFYFQAPASSSVTLLECNGELSPRKSTLPEVPSKDLSLEQFLGQRIKSRRINPLMAQDLNGVAFYYKYLTKSLL